MFCRYTLSGAKSGSMVFSFRYSVSLASSGFHVFFIVDRRFGRLILDFSQGGGAIFTFTICVFATGYRSMAIGNGGFRCAILGFMG